MPKGKLLDPTRKIRVMQKRSKKQEASIAEETGGRTQPGSGNQWHSKGDVVNRRWMIEAKTTGADSYRLKKADLQELILNAALAGVSPMMEIEFEGLTVVVMPRREAEGLGVYAGA